MSLLNVYGAVSFLVSIIYWEICSVYASMIFMAVSTVQIATVLNIIVKDYLFGWRISVCIQFVAATVLAVGMFLLPRSPRF